MTARNEADEMVDKLRTINSPITHQAADALLAAAARQAEWKAMAWEEHEARKWLQDVLASYPIEPLLRDTFDRAMREQDAAFRALAAEEADSDTEGRAG